MYIEEFPEKDCHSERLHRSASVLEGIVQLQEDRSRKPTRAPDVIGGTEMSVAKEVCLYYHRCAKIGFLSRHGDPNPRPPVAHAIPSGVEAVVHSISWMAYRHDQRSQSEGKDGDGAWEVENLGNLREGGAKEAWRLVEWDR